MNRSRTRSERRSAMKRKGLSVIVGLLIVAAVGPLRGQLDDCVTEEKCPEGVEPPACCAPPPCEVEEALARARAGRRMYDQGWAMIIQAQLGDTAQARDVYLSVMDDMDSFKNCEDAKHPQARAPDVTPDCRIGIETLDAEGDLAGFRELDKEQYVREANTCTELAEAAWERAAARQRFCQGVHPNERSSLAGMIRGGFEAYDAELNKLEEFTDKFWGACSTPNTIFRLPPDMIERAVKKMPRSTPPRKPARAPKAGAP
jgi:hypothetical protein